jgi:hypothetical protein
MVVLFGYSDDDLFTKKRYAWTGTTSVGSYAVSATSSHYVWASGLVRLALRETARGEHRATIVREDAESLRRPGSL